MTIMMSGPSTQRAVGGMPALGVTTGNTMPAGRSCAGGPAEGRIGPGGSVVCIPGPGSTGAGMLHVEAHRWTGLWIYRELTFAADGASGPIDLVSPGTPVPARAPATPRPPAVAGTQASAYGRHPSLALVPT